MGVLSGIVSQMGEVQILWNFRVTDGAPVPEKLDQNQPVRSPFGGVEFPELRPDRHTEIMNRFTRL
jgi:hypothetical protein